jgi:hypothetical protein
MASAQFTLLAGLIPLRVGAKAPPEKQRSKKEANRKRKI